MSRMTRGCILLWAESLLMISVTLGKWDCLDLDSKEYYGNFNNIVLTSDVNTKYPCLNWRDVPQNLYPIEYNASFLAENYCRVLSKHHRGAKCAYRNELNVTEVEYCRVPPCEAHSGCVSGSGEDYRDNGRYTDSGHQCLSWKNSYNLSVNPSTHPNSGLVENYCRNPDNSTFPWCYYLSGDDVLRDVCRIKPCTSEALTHFRRLEGVYIPAYNSRYIEGFKKTAEDCAIACIEESSFVCRGFEYREVWPFSNRRCILTSENIYTLGIHETINEGIGAIDLFTRLDTICDAFVEPAMPENCPLPLTNSSRLNMVVSASSSYSASHLPENGRLNGANWWRPLDSEQSPWIQICFEHRAVITGLFIQGSGSEDTGWVDKFSIGYSLDSINWWCVRDYMNISKPIVEFQGNAEPRCVKSVSFSSSLRAKCLRLYPKKGTRTIGLRMELLGCLDNDCDEVVGLSTNAIPNTSFSTSAADGPSGHSPHMARVNPIHSVGGWIPGTPSRDIWLQVDLLREHRIHAVVTQGCDSSWVSQYTITYFRNDAALRYTNENGQVMVFDGNTDAISLKTNYIDSPIIASSIRMHPISWHNHICLRLEFVGCVNRVCFTRLGVESGLIKDHQLSASTAFSKLPVEAGRLHYETWEPGDRTRACWGSKSTNGLEEYIQVDLERLHTITGVITQGSGDDWYYHWITSYRLDFLSSIEDKYHTYLDIDGSEMIFSGNFDQNTEVLNVLTRPIVTRVVRIKPFTWHNVSHCIRVEIVGCSYQEFGDVCDMDGTFMLEGYCLGSVNNQLPNACHDIFSETSHLVSIKSEATFMFLQEMVRQFIIDQQQYYKIGLTSQPTNMSSYDGIGFSWEDGTPQTLNLFRNSRADLNPDHEYCVQMLLFDNLAWDAYDCSSMSALRASLCQSDINECIGPRNLCSHGCFNTPGSYYCYCPPGMIIDPNDLVHCIDLCQTIVQPRREADVATAVESSSCLMYHSAKQEYATAGSVCERNGARLLFEPTYNELYIQNFTMDGTFTSWVMTNSSLETDVCCFALITGDDESMTYQRTTCNQTKSFVCSSEFEQLSCQDSWTEEDKQASTTASMGSIEAMAYGPYYMAGKSCKIEITGPVGLVIRVVIHRAALRKESSGFGCYDELVVTDIDVNDMEDIRGVYSGTMTNQSIICRSNHVVLQLRIGCISASMPDLLGYEATYSSIDCNKEKCDTGCDPDQEFTSVSGRISSQGFPMRLPPFSACSWRIRAPTGMFINITFEKFDIKATTSGNCTDSLFIQEHNRSLAFCGQSPPLFISKSNEVTLKYTTGLDVYSNGFQASYQQTDRSGCGIGYRSCDSVYYCTSEKGVLTSPNYPFSFPQLSQCVWSIVTSTRTFIEIQFIVLDIPSSTCQENYIEIIGLSSPETRFCNANLMTLTKIRSLRNNLRIQFTSSNVPSYGRGFYVEYVAKRFTPQTLNGTSLQNFTGPCPDSWILWNKHCYQMIAENRSILWVEAEELCEQNNATLVSISTRQEMDFIQYMLTNVWITEIDQIYIGLTDRSTEGSFRWIDGRPLSYSDWYYHSDDIASRQPNDGVLGGCSIMDLTDYGSTANWHDAPCAAPQTNQYICKKSTVMAEDQNPMISYIRSKNDTEECPQPLYTCGSGECIHEVFRCDRRIDCNDGGDEHNCSYNVSDSQDCENEMVSCTDGHCVSASFMCDFVRDCLDGKDEYECEYPECTSSEFRCDNGECVSAFKQCDLQPDCVDGSDEMFCEFCNQGYQCFDGSCIPPRAVCDGILDCPGVFHEDETDKCVTNCSSDQFSCLRDVCTGSDNECLYGFDRYHLQKGCRDLSHLTNCESFDCPASTFKCPDSYCIQLELRCNGEWDCPHGDDEKHCDKYNCPGVYRCHGASSCVGLHQLCNGIQECPNGDDELFCDVSCPANCECVGLVIKCTKITWNADRASTIHRATRILTLSMLNKYREIRSVGGEDSITYMLHLNLSHYMLLVKLDISFNGLEHLSPGTFLHQRNLRELSLANNEITSLSENAFAGLVRLTKLNLSGNPLMSISPGAFHSLRSLPVLNLCKLKLSEIEAHTFEGLESVQALDLSFNVIKIIERNGLRGLNKTSILNLTGNEIHVFDEDFLDDLISLTELYSDIFLFCCMRPELEVCRPEPGPFSSCSDLIRSARLRVFMWILGLSAFIGNVAVILWRIKTQEKNSVQSFLIFNLAVSDCSMGVYMLIIASADLYFRDVYVYQASQWRSSFTCSCAGILSVVSSEVSVYILTLISLDRFVCVVFPFGKFKLTRNRAHVAMSIGWICGIIIALLPALGLKYFGGTYYGRSGVCLAIPFDKSRPPGWIFSVAIFLGLNFICLLIIAVCYIAIIIAAKRSARSIRSSKTISNDLKLASRTAMIVATDMLCWLPIVVLGTLGTAGYIEVPPTVYAWTAIFILPINSSINPYLYTFSTIKRKRTRRSLSYENGRSINDSTSTRLHRQIATTTGTPNNMVSLRKETKELKTLHSVPSNLTMTEVNKIVEALEEALKEIHSLHLHPNNIQAELVIEKERTHRWRVFVALPFSSGKSRKCTCNEGVKSIIKQLHSTNCQDTEI